VGDDTPCAFRAHCHTLEKLPYTRARHGSLRRAYDQPLSRRRAHSIAHRRCRARIGGDMSKELRRQSETSLDCYP